jgi:hypothetical protein
MHCGRVSLLGLPKDTLVLNDTHRPELFRTVVFVQDIIGVFPQFLHVGPDEHLAELDKVAVFLVVHFNHTPGVLSSSDLTTIGRSDHRVGSDHSEWDLALMVSEISRARRGTDDDLLVLLDSLFVLVLVRWGLEDSDPVVVDIGEDLDVSSPYVYVDCIAYPVLEQGDLLLGQSIRLGNNGNKVDLLMQPPHKLDIDRFQPECQL